MSPLEIATIRRKLMRMVEDLDRLSGAADLDHEAWGADEQRRDAAGRRLQTCIEGAIDLNAHLLVSPGHAASESAYQSFLDLANKTDILAAALAAELASSAGLRNHLLHRYCKLDDALVLAGVRSAVEYFPRYIEAISAYENGLDPRQDARLAGGAA